MLLARSIFSSPLCRFMAMSEPFLTCGGGPSAALASASSGSARGST